MEQVEATGKTIVDAISQAADILGVSPEAVAYEVQEEGNKGFFGIGGTPTTIKAWIKDGYEAGKVKSDDEADVGDWDAVCEDIDASISSGNSKKETPAAAPPKPAEPKAQEPAQVDIPAADFSERLVALVKQIVDAMGIEAEVRIKSDKPEEVTVELIGEDVGIIIGKHGSTLDSLQYLVGIAANKGHTEKRRIVLDAEGYRDKQCSALEKKAKEYARAVRERGEEAVLEPQPARDRRVIHMTLADDPDVYTYSEGEGEDRHVVISPRK